MKLKKHNIALILLFSFYFAFLIYLAVKSSIESDEGTHLLVSVFYKDVMKYALTHPSISAIYKYGLTYLTYYPKVTIYYPPLIEATRGLLFGILGESYILGRLVTIVITALFILMLYKFSMFLYKEEKVAILTVLIFASIPIVIYLGRSTLLDLPVGFFTGLTAYMYLRAYKSGKKKDYLTAGFTMFLGFMVKWFIGLLAIALFLYWMTENRKHLKYLLYSFVLFGVLSLPYVYLMFKLGVVQPLFQPQGAFFAGYGEGDPQFTSIAGWLHYGILINRWYFVFPLSILLILSLIFYFKNKSPHWKFFTIWILVFYTYLTISPNKDHRYIIDLITPLVLMFGVFSYELAKKFGVKFIAIFAILLVINASMAFKSYAIKFNPTYDQEVADFLLQNKEPFYLTSETTAIYPSYLMFNLVKEGEFVKSYRYCLLEKSTDFSQTLYGYGIKWVVHDPLRKTITIDPKMANVMDMLKENNLVEFERKIGDIEIYRFKYYDGHEPPRCNYICLLRNTVCVN